MYIVMMKMMMKYMMWTNPTILIVVVHSFV